MKISKALLPLLLQAAARVRKPVLSAAVATLAVSALYSQTITTGDIAGIVKDSSGALVPGAIVTLKSSATGETRTQTVGQTGEYRFSILNAGRYQIAASSAGLLTDTATVAVSIGQTSTLDLIAKPQGTQQTVEVTDSISLVQSDNANLATTYNAQQIENLPAPGNDMTSYAFTAPGVTVSTGGGYGNFSVFGLPGVSNLFTINGADNMDPYLNLNNSGASNLTLGSNEISEAAVVMNGYTGQYGRQAGANVNYVTKSGTNDFHGNAGWWYNERVLNANDFFNNSSGTARPFSISNEWADSFGGPILKNKLFFFVDNEGLRYVLPGGTAGPVYIPSTAFSNYVLGSLATNNPAAVPFYQQALKLYGTSSGAGRATPVGAATDKALGCGDILTSGTAIANAAAAAGFGTAQPCASTFRSTVNNLNTEWLLATRVDFNPTTNDRIYVRYNTDHGVQATGTDPINSAFNANSIQPSYGGQLGYTRVVSPTMVNQLVLSASYYTAIFGPPNLPAALSTFPTTFNFSDGLYTALGGSDYGYPSGRKVRQWQLLDDYSITHGNHNIKFGANVRKNFISTYAYGNYTSGLATFNSMTDFLTGSFATGTNTGSNYAQSFANIGAEALTMYSAGFYGQDEWKLRPNFTVTMAVRFDRNSNIGCAAGCFNELRNQPFGQVNHAATTPYNATIATGLHEAFPSVEPVVTAPRIGFAWNASKSTVLRGGAGIFSDLYQGLIADRLITNSPAVAQFTTYDGLVATSNPNSIFSAVANSYGAFRNGFANGATLSQLQTAVPLGFNAPNFNTVGKKLYNPKYYEWNLELQQGFGADYMLSLNYVGNHGYQEVNQTYFANAYAPNGFQGLPTTAPDSRFGQVRELSNQGYSNYDGFVSSLHWRTTSAFTGTVSYTWGHSLDTCSNGCLEPYNYLTATSLRSQLSPLGLRTLNYASSDYDVRHSLSSNYVYTVPTKYFHNGLLKAALGGWTAAGTVYFHSGYPFSIVNTSVRGQNGIQNASGIATQPILADPLAGAAITQSCTTPNVSCYRASEFVSAANQHDFGVIGRNAFRGPNYFDTDLNVNKVFSYHERLKLLVGANFFNILNHPNFDLPVNNVSSGAFGLIQSSVSAPTSAYGSFTGSDVSGRVIQSQVKLTF